MKKNINLDLGRAPILTRELGEELRVSLQLDAKDTDPNSYLITVCGNCRGTTDSFAKAFFQKSVETLNSRAMGKELKYDFQTKADPESKENLYFNFIFYHKMYNVQIMNSIKNKL